MQELNKDYVTKWVEWFLVEQDKQGMEREVRDSLEECLGMFFASQQAFELHTKNISAQGLKCPKCHGRGHSNLYLASDPLKPVTCINCNGTGLINHD